MASKIKVVHDLKRQILEITSLIRVMNNYYYKKNKAQNQIKPLIFNKFKESLKKTKKESDGLHLMPNSVHTLDFDYINKKDSFKFPDSIVLFEAWMNLGFNAISPKIVIHYKFPGFLKGEKARHLFQFIFSFSRGFGFPIYFGPEFYDYILTYGKILEPLLRWSHTVCHRANQAIFLVEKRYNIKRHHPGEFESVIISESKNCYYKGIDTLLHGYFKKDFKNLGKFQSLKEVIQKAFFSYSIGDHAMSIDLGTQDNLINVPLVSSEEISNKYDVDLFSYVKKIMSFKKTLIKKILFYKNRKKNLKQYSSRLDKLKLFFNRSKSFKSSALKSSKKIYEIEKINLYVHVMEKTLELLWTSTLKSHTLHYLSNKEKKYLISKHKNGYKKYPKLVDSTFLLLIRYYENKYKFKFEEMDVIDKIDELRDYMRKIWVKFEEKQFNFALKELKKISKININNKNYNIEVNKILENLIPIFSIYEIFNRSLSEFIYPESIPHTKRLGAYIASFLTSKYNLFGINLMNLFNRLAFYNWSYFIVKNKLNRKNFYKFILKLPIWKYIPLNVKSKLLKEDFK